MDLCLPESLERFSKAGFSLFQLHSAADYFGGFARKVETYSEGNQNSMQLIWAGSLHVCQRNFPSPTFRRGTQLYAPTNNLKALF